MSTYTLPNIETDPKNYLFLICCIELIFLLLLLKSVFLSLVFITVVCSIYFIYLFPEFGFVFALTGNVLLYVFFDYNKVNITAPVVIVHFFLLSFGSIIFWIRRSRTEGIVPGKPFWIAVFIGLIMIAGLIFSSNKSYGIEKVLFYFIFNMPVIFVVLFFRNDLRRIENLLTFAYILGIILGLFSISILFKYSIFRFERFSPSASVNPIFLSRSLGVSCISSLFLLKRFKSLFLKIVLFSTLPILIMPMIWSGSRAPLIGMFLAFWLFYLLQPSEPVYRKIIFTLLGLMAVVYFMISFAGQIAERIITPVAEDTSTAFRFLGWFQAVIYFLKSPIIGIGTGSYLLDNPILPFRYPHNLILELACENGLPGLILILIFTYLPIKYSISNIKYFGQAKLIKQQQLSIVIFCVYLYTLWNAMFSGDIPLNAVVWFSAGLTWVLYISRNNIQKNR